MNTNAGLQNNRGRIETIAVPFALLWNDINTKKVAKISYEPDAGNDVVRCAIYDRMPATLEKERQ
jgi:hypothetical protein